MPPVWRHSFGSAKTDIYHITCSPEPKRLAKNTGPALRSVSCMKRIFLSLLGLIVSTTAGFAQDATVADSTRANGTYATLKAAFDALNVNTSQTGNNVTASVVGK